MARQGGGRRRNLGMWGVLAALLLAFGGCLLSAGLAMRVYGQRTANVSDVSLTIPTQEPTATLPPNETATPQFAATPTLVPSPTPLLGSADADFTIGRTGADLFSAEPNQWTSIQGISPTYIVEEDDTWNGSQDLTALWKLAYDDTFLYGFVSVQDDVIAQTQTPRTAYLGDSLELEVDTLNDKALGAQPDDYQFIISPGDFGSVEAGIFRFRGVNGVMVDDVGISAEVIATQIDGGYSLQFRIPWLDLRLAGPRAALGIALNINDNDAPGVTQQELMLSNVATRQWAQPATWGTVTLGD